ncbi:MAG: glycosyltransferase family 39 protein [Bacteroidia bacterium]
MTQRSQRHGDAGQRRGFATLFLRENLDTWETKLRCSHGCRQAPAKLFGYNELAVRLPSAIAALLTAVLLWWFCAKRNMSWLGFFAAIALMASRGFNDLHIARTGDHDSILTLLIMGYSLLVFDLVENEQGSTKKMLWLGLLISLAVLAKSIAGFFAVPDLLYVIFRRKLGYFLRSKWLYAATGICLAIVGGYYALREYYYPGQLELVWQNELCPLHPQLCHV